MSAIQSAGSVSAVNSTSAAGRSAKKVSRSENKTVEREGRFDRNLVNSAAEPENKLDSAKAARAALDAVSDAAANGGNMSGCHKADHKLLNVMIE